MNDIPTPLESFIGYKADTGMQCGNYSIDVPPLKEGEQYRFHFDATKCVGCRCCEVACNEQNNNPADIKWRRVGEMEGGSFPDTLLLFNSMSCNHCVDPACLIGCPTNSYIKFDNGIVFHDDPSCIGCQYCTWNCPYGVPTYHEERHIVTKCHMCHERLALDQSPACVQACPSGAIEIEAVNITQWLEKDIDESGNMPHLANARLTNSTTRFTLPDTMPLEMLKADEHHLKPAHGELPLVFMTILTQMSLGAFGALFIGDILSLFGFFKPTWIFALVALVPAALGLPMSALHLGRPLKALSAMKNLKTSWLSREAAALGAFAGLMSLNVVLYFFDIATTIRLAYEAFTLLVGIYGIHAQAMIYRIPARPSWDRFSTNQKFFSTAYSGLFLITVALVILGYTDSATPLLSSAMILAVIHGFFTLGAYNELKTSTVPQLEKTLRLYREHFVKIHTLRWITLGLGALALPLLSTLLIASGLITAAIVTLTLGFVLSVASELCDRFLFYTTTVPLQMAGGFFVGAQRK
ncbi:MAG: DmsC/YnfH family molybdoenzyme membrane anchor subunit [Sulfuricurvum sp.]|jgi:DMSO reductase iron-sulfur subunit